MVGSRLPVATGLRFGLRTTTAFTRTPFTFAFGWLQLHAVAHILVTFCPPAARFACALRLLPRCPLPAFFTCRFGYVGYALRCVLRSSLRGCDTLRGSSLPFTFTVYAVLTHLVTRHTLRLHLPFLCRYARFCAVTVGYLTCSTLPTTLYSSCTLPLPLRLLFCIYTCGLRTFAGCLYRAVVAVYYTCVADYHGSHTAHRSRLRFGCRSAAGFIPRFPFATGYVYCRILQLPVVHGLDYLPVGYARLVILHTYTRFPTPRTVTVLRIYPVAVTVLTFVRSHTQFTFAYVAGYTVAYHTVAHTPHGFCRLFTAAPPSVTYTRSTARFAFVYHYCWLVLPARLRFFRLLHRRAQLPATRCHARFTRGCSLGWFGLGSGCGCRRTLVTLRFTRFCRATARFTTPLVWLHHGCGSTFALHTHGWLPAVRSHGYAVTALPHARLLVTRGSYRRLPPHGLRTHTDSRCHAPHCYRLPYVLLHCYLAVYTGSCVTWFTAHCLRTLLPRLRACSRLLVRIGSLRAFGLPVLPLRSYGCTRLLHCGCGTYTCLRLRLPCTTLRRVLTTRCLPRLPGSYVPVRVGLHCYLHVLRITVHLVAVTFGLFTLVTAGSAGYTVGCCLPVTPAGYRLRSHILPAWLPLRFTVQFILLPRLRLRLPLHTHVPDYRLVLPCHGYRSLLHTAVLPRTRLVTRTFYRSRLPPHAVYSHGRALHTHGLVGLLPLRYYRIAFRLLPVDTGSVRTRCVCGCAHTPPRTTRCYLFTAFWLPVCLRFAVRWVTTAVTYTFVPLHHRSARCVTRLRLRTYRLFYTAVAVLYYAAHAVGFCGRLVRTFGCALPHACGYTAHLPLPFVTALRCRRFTTGSARGSHTRFMPHLWLVLPVWLYTLRLWLPHTFTAGYLWLFCLRAAGLVTGLRFYGLCVCPVLYAVTGCPHLLRVVTCHGLVHTLRLPVTVGYAVGYGWLYTVQFCGYCCRFAIPAHARLRVATACRITRFAVACRTATFCAYARSSFSGLLWLHHYRLPRLPLLPLRSTHCRGCRILPVYAVLHYTPFWLVTYAVTDYRCIHVLTGLRFGSAGSPAVVRLRLFAVTRFPLVLLPTLRFICSRFWFRFVYVLRFGSAATCHITGWFVYTFTTQFSASSAGLRLVPHTFCRLCLPAVAVWFPITPYARSGSAFYGSPVHLPAVVPYTPQLRLHCRLLLGYGCWLPRIHAVGSAVTPRWLRFTVLDYAVTVGLRLVGLQLHLVYCRARHHTTLPVTFTRGSWLVTVTGCWLPVLPVYALPRLPAVTVLLRTPTLLRCYWLFTGLYPHIRFVGCCRFAVPCLVTRFATHGYARCHTRGYYTVATLPVLPLPVTTPLPAFCYTTAFVAAGYARTPFVRVYYGCGCDLVTRLRFCHDTVTHTLPAFSFSYLVTVRTVLPFYSYGCCHTVLGYHTR